MMLTIIEDSSPYYVKFSMTTAGEIAGICNAILDGVHYKNEFISHPIEHRTATEIIKLIPFFENIQLNVGRLSMFISRPGIYRPPHKDGARMQFGINIPIEILDNECTTNWYTDESLSKYDYYAGPDIHNGQHRQIRELRNYRSGDIVPIASTTMKSSECMLFNVNQFHDWSNKTSLNRRVILALRPYLSSTMTFADAATLLFGVP